MPPIDPNRSAHERRQEGRRDAQLLLSVRELPRAELRRLLEARHPSSATTEMDSVPIDGLDLQTTSVINSLPNGVEMPPAMRLNVRKQLQTLARNVRHDDTVVFDETVDISPTGLGYDSACAQKPATALELTITSRTREHYVVLLGIVVFCQEHRPNHGAHRWRIGLDFIDLRPDELAALQQIIG